MKWDSYLRKPFKPFTAVPAVLSLLAALHSVGQVPKINALNRVTLNRQDTLFQFYTARPVTGKAAVAYTYYWFKPDTILATKGGFDGKWLHGDYEVFFPNKNLAEKGQFEHGLKVGEWRSWYANGALKSITHWSRSKKQGRFLLFDETGARVEEGTYKDDLLTGKLTHYAADTVVSRQLYRKGTAIAPKPAKKSRKTPETTDAVQP